MGHLKISEKSDFDKTPVEWLGIGAELNLLVNQWAERGDIVTFVGEGAGGVAPACFIPSLAEMQVNVAQAFGEEVDPLFIGDLSDRDVQFDHPVAMGAVMHEAFHAKHSHYDLREVATLSDRFISGLVTWFEETRIEARAIETLPANRAFLRACALRLVIGDLKDDEDFAARGIQAFSQLILLTLARVSAGVLDAEDVEVIHDAALKLFGEDTLNALRSVWERAQADTDDEGYSTRLALAEEWVEILKDSGNDPSDDSAGEIPDWLKELLEAMMGSGAGESGEGEGEDSDGESEGSGSGGLLARMAENTEIEAQSEANSQAIQEHDDRVTEARNEAAAESENHKEEASKVYSRGTGPGGGRTSSRLVEKRDPTSQERIAAVALSKALERAQYRDRVVVKRGSVIPPGRMNARRALAQMEQSSRGAIVTAEAWTRKMRKHADDPTLTVGALVDISGSMGGAMEPMASTAWILAEATRRVQAQCSMVYYGDSVFPTLAPGERMNQVNVYSAPDGTEKFDQAFRALDGRIGLLNGSGARLLVIVSDLFYTGFEIERTKYWMKRCREAGVAVVVIPFDYDDTARSVASEVRGVSFIPSSKTETLIGAAQAIGEAAVRQLQEASQ